ncbi:MAG: hypothetical protein PHX53_16230, partial [Syntrophales bacterium]|nr:hypothetical protein [Syntrophales bacterium]
YNASIYLGMMLSSAFMGGAIGVMGYGLSFALTAALVLLVTWFFYRLLRDFSGRPESGEEGPGT